MGLVDLASARSTPNFYLAGKISYASSSTERTSTIEDGQIILRLPNGMVLVPNCCIRLKILSYILRLMKSYVIIVADTGTLKAYFTRETSLQHRRKADLIKKVTYTKAHTKMSEQLSESKGTFRGSGDARSPRRGSGEAHHLKTEMLKTSLRGLAHDIEGVISHTPADEYYLSLPKAIHNSVTDELTKITRAKVTKVLALDLTKDTLDDIRKKFKV